MYQCQLTAEVIESIYHMTLTLNVLLLNERNWFCLCIVHCALCITTTLSALMKPERLKFAVVVFDRSIGDEWLNAHCTGHLSCPIRRVLLLQYPALSHERSGLLIRAEIEILRLSW